MLTQHDFICLCIICTRVCSHSFCFCLYVIFLPSEIKAHIITRSPPDLNFNQRTIISVTTFSNVGLGTSISYKQKKISNIGGFSLPHREEVFKAHHLTFYSQDFRFACQVKVSQNLWVKILVENFSSCSSQTLDEIL